VEELEASDDPAAQLALAVFCYRVSGAVASMATALGGLDALVFTAGIGEGSSRVREQVCVRLGFLGVRLDQEANRQARPDVDVAANGSPARVWVVHTREDVIAARAARAVL
jgi:acetate kinase